MALAGCASSAPGPSSSQAVTSASTVPTSSILPGSAAPQATVDRDTAWRADIAALVPGMAAIHPSIAHSTTRGDLDAAAEVLSSRVGTATDDELMVGVLRIVAMVSAAGCDAHTGAFIWGAGRYPVDSLPLRLWLFAKDDGDDEVVVVDALSPNEALIGAQVTSVNGKPIADVLQAIDPIVPRDNAQTVRLLTPRFLLIPQVLRGLHLVDEGPVSLGIEAQNGAPSTIDLEPIPMAEYNGWAGPYGLHLPADPGVRYLSRIGDALWWEILDDGETLYVQYNRVDAAASSQLDQLQRALDDPAVARIALDIRHNFGGEVSALDAITPILIDAASAGTGRLFVITGRNTFSAGSMLAARLLKDGKATIVGEPTGGCPTIWSDPEDLRLTNSGIVVSVAHDVAVGVDPNDPRLTIEPSVAAVLTHEAWAAREDPSMELFAVDKP